MIEQDRQRLDQLMKHYRQPYTQSHELLQMEREKHEAGILPDSGQEARENSSEFEGPFFCRVIAELLKKSEAIAKQALSPERGKEGSNG